MEKLDARLLAVSSLVLPGKTAADIGSDHMHLPQYLIRKGICPFVIASDKAPEPCRSGAALIRALGLQDKISVRCGDGLSVLQPGEAATLILTGMGGCLIRNILAACPDVLNSAERLVLSPQKNPERLRLFLAENGWAIRQELMLKENGIRYVILAAEPGEMQLTEEQALLGPCLLQDGPPEFQQQLREQLAEDAALLTKLEQNGAGEERRQELRDEMARCEELLARYENGITKLK